MSSSMAVSGNPPAGPDSRVQAAEGQGPLGSGRLVYDEQRSRVLLVDAAAASGPVADARPLRTWSWDGRSWIALASAGPAWRVATAAVYDARRQRVVLFGGATIPATASLGDTWETCGSAWDRRDAAGPSGRDHHALAYDPGRGRTVLFGGGTFVRGAPYRLRADTWEWDGVQWRQMSPAGPGARRLPGMAYDGNHRQIVLFGGIGPRNSPDLDPPYFGDTWLWNGQSWRQAADGGPPPRYGHLMTHDSQAGVTLIYGGNTLSDKPLADMWQWNGRQWLEIAFTGTTPGPRFGGALVHDRARGRTVLFGGRRDDTSVWEWDGTRWKEVKTQ